MNGRDGRDGRDGVMGEKGERGDPGLPGEMGGEKGEKGEMGDGGPQGIPGSQGAKGERGEKGDHGSQGLSGPTGPQGEKGDIGEKGESGVQGAAHSGGVYIRWGRTSCPNDTGIELVYSGRAGGSNTLTDFACYPIDDPEYSNTSASGSLGVNGITYASHPAGLNGESVPCAVCYSPLRPTIMMIPARLTCPPNWTSEYAGYLMGNSYWRSEHECIDQDPESIPGCSSAYDFTPMSISCGDCCPPYSSGGEALTCVVCSR